HWPGVVAPGQKSHEPIIGVDFFPTFCELASSALPEGQPVDGISLLPYLKGEVDELPQRSLFWHFPAYLQSYSIKNEQRDVLFRSRPCSIIRKGPWKLHEYFEDGALELYHLEDDIGEKTNLAQSQPELAQALRDELETWRKTIKAPVPRKLNPAYRPEVETQAMLEVRSSLDSSTR
ncbi:MAG: sulfatase/phosphatase domain-containing protein, partial [Verrucomicrobiota bacterium]